jgi:dihydrofolate reductase
VRKVIAAMKLSLDGRSEGPDCSVVACTLGTNSTELKSGPGKDIYLMGGAMLTGAMLDAGLVDEMHCIVYPLLVGPAKGPFGAVTGRRRLTLLQQRPLGAGRLHVAYRVG